MELFKIHLMLELIGQTEFIQSEIKDHEDHDGHSVLHKCLLIDSVFILIKNLFYLLKIQYHEIIKIWLDKEDILYKPINT